MKITVNLTVDDTVMDRIEAVAKAEGKSPSKLVGEILGQIAATEDGHLARVISVTAKDLEEFEEMFIGLGHDEANAWDLGMQRIYLGASCSVEAQEHRDHRMRAKPVTRGG